MLKRDYYLKANVHITPFLGQHLPKVKFILSSFRPTNPAEKFFSLKRNKNHPIIVMSNNGGASNKNDSQIKRHRRLPLELQCEVFCALPFHYGGRMLLLCRPIASNCVALVRKQKQKFEEFKNRWNPSACEDGLTIIKPKRLVVQNNGKIWRRRSVFAERPLPKKNSGIFYYEVKLLAKESIVRIGLSTKKMPLMDVLVGVYKGFYAYGSWGTFMGHEVKGCSLFNGYPYIDGKPKFEEGDVIGCGVDLATRQIIYTKNGRRLETTGLFVADSVAKLFPCISLYCFGTNIEANFGPHFEFKF